MDQFEFSFKGTSSPQPRKQRQNNNHNENTLRKLLWALKLLAAMLAVLAAGLGLYTALRNGGLL